jgi:hypothetical protein
MEHPRGRPNEDLERLTWRVGQRVRRTDADAGGTVVEEGILIKVKWDRGATSYYRSHEPANIRLTLE